ncbi:MAG: carboxypeptidase-like regulatory domain-containing protein [bacterium]|nr:carboxypeptidase-like regulatory domain-containing protein [bacterium]
MVAPEGLPHVERVVLRGRLLDSEGEAIAGAAIRYVPDAATLKAVVGALPERDGEFAVAFPGFSIDEAPAVVTGPDGRFELQTWRSMDRSEENWNSNLVWPAGGLVVTAPGYAVRLLTHHWTDPPERDFGEVLLMAELAVDGVVVDESGRPIAGARIRVEHSGTWDEVWRTFDIADVYRLGLTDKTQTDPDGRFRLGGLSTGGHHFSIKRDGFGTAVSWIAGASGMTVGVGEVPLTRVEGICGVVRDEGGAAVPGASIWLADAYFDRGITPGFLAGPPLREGESGWTDPLVRALRDRKVPGATSDRNGEFCAFGPGGPSYDLYAVADGFELSRVEDVGDGRRDVGVALATRTTPVAPDPLAWPRQDEGVAELQVAVRDAHGHPVPGAAVFGARWSFEEGEPIGETNGDGMLLTKVSPAKTTVVYARRGTRWSTRAMIDWRSQSRLEAALTVVETGGIEGLALDENGHADPYAWLSLTPLDIPNDLHPDRPDERADAEGRFKFSELLPGRYEVTSHFRFEGWQGTEVVVAAGRSAEAVVTTERSSPRLRGLVTSGGRPVVWAKIEGRINDPERFGYYMSYSLRDGKYDAWVDRVGDYDLAVETTGGGRSKPIRVSIGEGEVATADFRLPTGGIGGTVVTRVDGSPVGGIIVALFDKGNDFVARASDFTDAEGRFTFSELDDGEYVVRTTRVVSYWPDYAGQSFSLSSMSVAVHDGAIAEITFREEASASIVGSVRTSSGMPARDGTEICAVRIDVDPPEPPVPDDCVARSYSRSGRFVIEALNRATHRVAAEAASPSVVRERGVVVDLSAHGRADADVVVRGARRPRDPATETAPGAQ